MKAGVLIKALKETLVERCLESGADVVGALWVISGLLGAFGGLFMAIVTKNDPAAYAAVGYFVVACLITFGVITSSVLLGFLVFVVVQSIRAIPSSIKKFIRDVKREADWIEKNQ